MQIVVQTGSAEGVVVAEAVVNVNSSLLVDT